MAQSFGPRARRTGLLGVLVTPTGSLWRILTSSGTKAIVVLENRGAMARSINLSLTDELRAFLDENSGDGTLFATPSEFVRALIRERKERQEAAELRKAILEGYGDVLHGRVLPLTGELRSMVAEAKRRDGQGWG